SASRKADSEKFYRKGIGKELLTKNSSQKSPYYYVPCISAGSFSVCQKHRFLFNQFLYFFCLRRSCFSKNLKQQRFVGGQNGTFHLCPLQSHLHIPRLSAGNAVRHQNRRISFCLQIDHRLQHADV